MRFYKLAGSFLVSAALLGVTLPSFAKPSITERASGIGRGLGRPVIERVAEQIGGRVFYHSNSPVSGVDCRSITIYLDKYIPNTSNDYQTVNSMQAQGNFQKDGFCSYAFTVPTTSVISVGSHSLYRTRANDGFWSANSEPEIGGDLSLSPTLH